MTSSLFKASAGSTFALVVGVALVKKTLNPQYRGRVPYVASTREATRAKRPRSRTLSSPSRCLQAWFDTQRSRRTKAQ